MKHVPLIVFLLCIGCATTASGGDELISGVTISNQTDSGVSGAGMLAAKAKTAAAEDTPEAVVLSWNLAAAGKTTVLICDLRGNVVRTLIKDQELASGAHSENWDGLDDDGDACPGGVYVPVIETTATSGSFDNYSATGATWGNEVFAQKIDYSQNELSFTLPERAYGRVRIGLKDGGPIFITLVPWQVFDEGSHSLDWDGKDVTGTVDLNDRDDLNLVFDGFSLPENSIVLKGKVGLPSKKYAQYPLQPVNATTPSYYALYTEPLLPEPAFTVQLKGSGKNLGEKGTLTVTLENGAPAVNLSETMIFIDYTFLTEAPTTKSPAKITFDASEISPGRHLLTVNLITSDDRAASWSRYVTFR